MNPYEQGYTAARQGQAEWTNPHRYGTQEYAQWLAGYRRWAVNYRIVR
ncbi:hypothetical protein [Burkholderia ubonensis]|nr:hypothetical protein [Burkholderia ubonensis]